MAKLTWDETDKRLYETGVDHVALFLMNPSGSVHPYSQPVAWNGITGITESPDGADCLLHNASSVYKTAIRQVQKESDHPALLLCISCYKHNQQDMTYYPLFVYRCFL